MYLRMYYINLDFGIMFFLFFELGMMEQKKRGIRKVNKRKRSKKKINKELYKRKINRYI